MGSACLTKNTFVSGITRITKPKYAIEILDAISTGMEIKRAHSKLLGLLVPIFSFIPIVRKAYGGVEYTKELSKCFDGKYRVVDFKEGIKRTVSISI